MTPDPGFDPVPPDQGDPAVVPPSLPEGDEEDGVEAVTPEDAMEYEDSPLDLMEDTP